jgi:hydroxymethylpyrimidine pyrophosphatase-like HAD family hydrolase
VTLVVASDLDRTLIWSSRAGAKTGGAVCVERYAGQPLSYVPAAVEAPLEALMRGGRLVPVTTRTQEQLDRVRLPGGPARYAICLNGGRVLVAGEEDTVHRDRVRLKLADAAPHREAGDMLTRWVGSLPDSAGAFRLRQAEGMFHYAVFDDVLGAGPELDRLRDEVERLDWQVSVQGRKLYVVPRTLTKESALQHLEEHHGVRVVASAGDSALDAGMLASFGGWAPRGCELERTDRVPAGTRLTVHGGLRATTEIVTALADALDAADTSSVVSP